jgi:hypothetical protein
VMEIKDKGARRWDQIAGTWARDVGDRWASIEKIFIRVRLDVGRRLSRFDVKIRRNQRKKRAADW